MNWRGLMLDNLGWKLFSLLIAFLVWSTYHISGGSFRLGLLDNMTAESWPGYRPRILTRQNDLYRYRIVPEEVSISVAGRRESMSNLRSRDRLAYVDANDYVVGGTNLVPVQVRTLPGITVTQIKPEKVLIERIPSDSPRPN